MKNQIKKMMCLSIAMLVATSMFAGCGPTSEGGQDNANKTVLHVGNYDGGIGHTWLEEAEKRFEETYKDWVNPDDPSKVGINIEIVNGKTEFTDTTLIGNLPYQDIDMYYTGIYYDATVQSGGIENITSWIEEKVYDETGELASLTGKPAVKSILDTMDSRWAPVYNLSKDGGNEYYAIPYYYSVGGIWFDGDLFDEKGLYFDKYGQMGVAFDDPDISAGPDGIYGNYDDGQPATFTEFKALLDGLCQRTITPFTWSQANSYQRSSAITSFLVSYLGYEEAQKLWTEDDISGIINSEGEKAALAAAKLIGGNASKYASKRALESNTHTGAQEEFIYSKYSTSNKIAMFMEYSWWENEIRDGFDDMASIETADGYGKRNFKLMCMPNFVGTEGVADHTNVGGSQTIYAESGSTAVIVNSKSTKKEIAKMFLQFEQQRSELVAYAANSSAFRPYDYLDNMTNEEYSSCTKMVQNVLDLMKQDNVNVVVGEIWSNKLRNNFAEFRGLPFKALMPSVAGEPILYFYNNPKTSIADYVSGVNSYYNRNW